MTLCRPKRLAMRITVSLLLILPLLASGCAGGPEGEFPSLAKRPYEDQAPITAPEAIPAPSSLPAALSRQVTALASRTQNANSAFNALLPATRNTAQAARGSAQSSAGWVNAHIALSRLDRTRADGVAALSEMDVLITHQLDAELTGQSPRYSELMKAAQQRMIKIIAGQNNEIERLGQTIGL